MAPQRIKDEDCGIHVLYDGAASNPHNAIDILAIHGMGAHPLTTWQQMRDPDANPRDAASWANPVNWLSDKDLLPAALPQARIMTYGYRSDWFGEARVRTRPSIISQALLAELSANRAAAGAAARPIVLVAHSFGGLVALQTMIDAAREADRFADVYRSVAGLVFLGTPFRGADAELSQAKILALSEEAHADRHLADGAETKNLRVLQDGDDSLAYMIDEYLSIARQNPSPVRVACFFEQKASDIGSLVGEKGMVQRVLVTEASGCLDTSEFVEKVARACDHFQINKFRANTPDWATMKRILMKMAAHAKARDATAVETRQLVGYRQQLLLTNPNVDLERLISEKGARTPGTGEWLLQTPAYQAWKEGKAASHMLWVSGGPGKGKTFTSLLLLDTLKRDSEVAFFFCLNKDQKRNRVTAILRSVLWQLITPRRPWILPYLANCLPDEETTAVFLESPSSLWILLTSILQDSRMSQVTLLLDGVDECAKPADANWLCQMLSEFFTAHKSSSTAEKQSTQHRLIIVSRPDLHITSQASRIDLDRDYANKIEADIRLCVHSGVASLSNLDGFNETSQASFEELLNDRAENSFLWLGLAITQLQQSETISEAQDITANLPQGMDASYERMLRQIKPQHREVCAKILRMLSVAARPLTISDLTVIFQDRPASETVSQEQYVRDQITHCGPILVMSTDEVHFVHLSAREYLLNTSATGKSSDLAIFLTGGEQAHFELCQSCLSLLATATPEQEQSSFFGYAVDHWPTHTGFLGQTLAKRLLRENSEYFDSKPLLTKWWQRYLPGHVSMSWQGNFRAEDKISSLHYAAFIGFLPWLEAQTSDDPSKKKGFFAKLKWETVDVESSGVTPLVCAILTGQTAAVELLLAKKANPNGPLMSSIAKPLNMAANRNHNEIVIKLLKAGAKRKHMLNEDDGGPVHLAAKRGYADTVRILLDAGVGVNLLDETYRIALHVSAKEVIPTLLDADAWINHKDEAGDTPLHVNTRCEASQAVELLLSKGANIDCTNYDGNTALHVAVDANSPKLVELLLDHGADVEAVNGLGNTVLLHAVTRRLQYRPRMDIVQILLDHGADPKATNSKGLGASALAKDQGFPDIEAMISEHEANLVQSVKDLSISESEQSENVQGDHGTKMARELPLYRLTALTSMKPHKTDILRLSYNDSEVCTTRDPTGEWFVAKRFDGTVGMAYTSFFNVTPGPDGIRPELPPCYYRRLDEKFSIVGKSERGKRIGASMVKGLVTSIPSLRAPTKDVLPLEARIAALRTRLETLRAQSSLDGWHATVRHTSVGQGDYELTVEKGDHLWVVEEWGKSWLRKAAWVIAKRDSGEIGIVAADYLDDA